MIVSICAVYWKKSNKEIESIKEELLASIIEIVSEDNSELNEAVWNAKQPSAAIAVINKYEALLKGENKKKINIVGKQEELLKNLRIAKTFSNISAQVDLTFTLKLNYINVWLNFLNWKIQRFHPAILTAILNCSKICAKKM